MTAGKRTELPGQVVLVLQGGGALGAYQAGVYEALKDAGIEPDWVIGTSIGAINGGLIAGNAPAVRLERLREFWQSVQQAPFPAGSWNTIFQGLPAFFRPRIAGWGALGAAVGLDEASFYTTEPLRGTLGRLIDIDLLREAQTRLTVGAVAVRSGQMTYFDSRICALGVDHLMASGALPPAFPAVRIDGEAYWDGGVYSNTPIEAVFDDVPRRSGVIFSVNVWQPSGDEPRSIWEALGRQKDIQYASRADSHIARQQQLHHLRHVIRELSRQLPAGKREAPEVRELLAYGCGTTMHVVRLLAPSLDSEDFYKDIDFSAAGIRMRWEAGHRDASRILRRAPWNDPVDPMQGVIVHELSARSGAQVRRAPDPGR
ncbi:patatin-like phospholipase family protein [Variovorax sp. JS1663]|uniref:patatin-like phospholipase family protein n=1 Tax=Variovorax sp. JS1663 TaxID=1851577 RepID=UPI000B34A08A|nr:patatin-like phospholipase family protein [Variovorax sp. JS1663]OUM03489.1 patatin [Variovorax sp. JS1663]